jgi:hypothetical protein
MIMAVAELAASGMILVREIVSHEAAIGRNRA